MTSVSPTAKSYPGLWLWINSTRPPELSVAVGSTQVTEVETVPLETLKLIGLGQLLMTGGVVSKVETIYQHKKHYLNLESYHYTTKHGAS